MGEETKRIWIIPGEGYEDRGLEDGVGIFYDLEIGNRDHGPLCRSFASKYNLDAENYYTHADFGKFFVEKGMILFMNLGLINGKRGGIFYLPANMTKKQIEFMEERKGMMQEKFHETILFGARVWPEGPLEYRSGDGFRDLEIESVIKGIGDVGTQDLMWQEIERQKEARKVK